MDQPKPSKSSLRWGQHQVMSNFSLNLSHPLQAEHGKLVKFLIKQNSWQPISNDYPNYHEIQFNINRK